MIIDEHQLDHLGLVPQEAGPNGIWGCRRIGSRHNAFLATLTPCLTPAYFTPIGPTSSLQVDWDRYAVSYAGYTISAAVAPAGRVKSRLASQFSLVPQFSYGACQSVSGTTVVAVGFAQCTIYPPFDAKRSFGARASAG
jgi:hypothetical protein